MNIQFDVPESWLQYFGRMGRRFLAVRIMPVVVPSLVPLALCALTATASVFLAVASAANALFEDPPPSVAQRGVRRHLREQQPGGRQIARPSGSALTRASSRKARHLSGGVDPRAPRSQGGVARPPA
jgi:hypothetical protein